LPWALVAVEKPVVLPLMLVTAVMTGEILTPDSGSYASYPNQLGTNATHVR
jgi:hypothetical protein